MCWNGRVLISDLRKVIWIDPETRLHGECADSAGMTFQNRTAIGEPILRKQQDGNARSFWKVTADWRLVPLDNIARDEMPQALGFTTSGEEIRYLHASKRIERVSSSREVVETLKISRTTGVSETMTVAQNGIYFSSETAVFFWPFGEGEREPVLVAGSPCCGKKDLDGVGRRARFRSLCALMLSKDERYIYIWDDHYGNRRLVRIDVLTDEARTLSLQSLDLVGSRFLIIPAASDDSFFLLDLRYLTQPVQSRLLRAKVMMEARPTGLSAWQALDMTMALQPISFHLSDGTVLYFDSRVLRARSEYFQKMLESGCREAIEAKVDLTSDASINRASLEIVLRFIATGSLLGSSHPEMTVERLFDVRTLADRYQLLELTEMVESQISERLCTNNVLTVLQKVLGSGHRLESACWDLVESKRNQILEETKDNLTQLIQECPELGTALLIRDMKRRRI